MSRPVPDGSLYYLSRLNDVSNPGFVHKISFSGQAGDCVDNPPTSRSPRDSRQLSPSLHSGTAPLTYRWQRGGVEHRRSTLVDLHPARRPTLADNGAQFRVVVTNSHGSTTSAAATLTVTTTCCRSAPS